MFINKYASLVPNMPRRGNLHFFMIDKSGLYCTSLSLLKVSEVLRQETCVSETIHTYGSVPLSPCLSLDKGNFTGVVTTVVMTCNAVRGGDSSERGCVTYMPMG